jgi:hypothetical protein
VTTEGAEVNPATDDPKSDGEAVQAALLHTSLLSKVKFIKTRHGGTIADIVSAFGGPGIDEEYRRVVAEIQAELGESGA